MLHKKNYQAKIVALLTVILSLTVAANSVCANNSLNIENISNNVLSNKIANNSFFIRSINNTSQNQILMYWIFRGDGQATNKGLLQAGDTKGIKVNIEGKDNDKESAEVVVTDPTGHLILYSKVAYYSSPAEFYVDTISVDSHYKVTTTTFPSIRTIAFDINN